MRHLVGSETTGHRCGRPAGCSGVQRRARAPHHGGGGARRRRPAAVARRRRHGRSSRALRRDPAGWRVDHRRLLGSRGVAGKALPTREVIDAATPNHPVFVKRLDGHMALANTLALTLAGIPGEASAPSAARSCETRAAGSPACFKDTAMDLVTRAMPPPTRDTILVEDARGAEARGGARRHDDAGHDGERGGARGVPDAARRGRADGADLVDPELRRDAASESAATSTGGDDWLRIGGRKFFADGSMGASTAAFFEPYADDPNTRGLLIHDPARLEELIVDADADGFPACRPRDRRPREHARARHFRAPACVARRAAGVAAAARARAGRPARGHRAVQARSA